MDDLLSSWILKHRTELEASGFQITLNEQHDGGSRSANFDSAFVVGTITCWPDKKIEFQFNSCKTGEVLVIEEESFSSIEVLNEYFKNLCCQSGISARSV